MARPVVGRLAPSPTGPLHLGHARSFLAAWWSARAAGGRILLRSEDLDFTRCTANFERQLVDDLVWLGLDWDGPLLRQSDDLRPYHAALGVLASRGRCYACTCTRKEILESIDAPHAFGEEPRYPGTCRQRFADRSAAEAATGSKAGLRLLVPEGWFETTDRLHGAVKFCPAKECGDFLLLRRDGAIAYQLSVVVDDARQGITEVVRGTDLLPSAVRQELLYRDLGLEPPEWCHLPLVLDRDGLKLSKRTGAGALAEWRARRRDPRELVAWCAQSLGLWPPSESPPLMSAADWLPRWNWANVPNGPTIAPELP